MNHAEIPDNSTETITSMNRNSADPGVVWKLCIHDLPNKSNDPYIRKPCSVVVSKEPIQNRCRSLF
jgi:hypothetical protein